MPKKVLSLGGSLVSPDSIDTQFLRDFRTCILEWLEANGSRQIALIVGGGSLARRYQNGYKTLSSKAQTKALDWIGIHATRLNASLVGSLFSEYTSVEYFQNYEENPKSTARILVAGGWKPGFSTDFCGVKLAQKLGVKMLVNLSNITKVYTADPKTNPEAKPIDEISWEDFQKVVGTVWNPGGNFPFDPVASEKSKALGLSVAVANGKDLRNLRKILDNKTFMGTLIKN